jgi:hypothetical protein
MDRMSHADQHRPYPPGTTVVAENGESLGVIRAFYAHYVLVRQLNRPHVDLEVPTHAIAPYDGERLVLIVNREALSEVDVEESAAR